MMQSIDVNERSWTGQCRCTECGGMWEQTARVGRTSFVCPRCQTETGHWTHAVLPPKGNNIWGCSCGCIAFTISIEGYFCMDCGLCTPRDEVVFRLN